MYIILDIDETLVHYTETGIIPRPGLSEFLSAIAQIGKIAIWSYGTEKYVNHVVDKYLKPYINPVFVFSRYKCFGRNKPLNLISNELGIPLSSILLIDDKEDVSPSYEINHITVKPFTGDSDDELIKLASFLLSNKDDTVQSMVVKWNKV